jgi:hypothetical protein
LAILQGLPKVRGLFSFSRFSPTFDFDERKESEGIFYYPSIYPIKYAISSNGLFKGIYEYERIGILSGRPRFGGYPTTFFKNRTPTII